MRIPYADIKSHIPEVVGAQVRINHDNCPSGSDTRQRLYIKRKDDAVLAYCHNCGGHRVHKLRRYAVRQADLIKQLLDEASTPAAERVVLLPDDADPDVMAWPADAAAWLYKYNITNDNIASYDIRYSPSWGRVILPVYSGGKLLFWQGRQIDGSGPKYVSVKGVDKPLFTALSTKKTVNAVIVEDMLSAIRVANTGVADGIALLGTAEPDDLPARISGYKQVFVALDLDAAGYKKNRPLADRLRLTTTGVKIHHASGAARDGQKQLKEFTPAALENVLSDTFGH